MGTTSSYDIVTVGGGLGGAALACVMAGRGARVLVVERERRFADRVRGEALQPWGVGEARALGLYELLRERCGQELRWLDMSFAGMQVVHRDLIATTPQAAPWLTFFHPAMQEALLEAATEAGAEVWRGARVRGVTPGTSPTVTVERDGTVEEVGARLVVGADGRSSTMRRWAGFEVRSDPDRILFSGVLLDGLRLATDTGLIFFHPDHGRHALFFPQPGGRVRAYVGFHHRADPPPRDADLARFVAEAVHTGVPAEMLADARTAGPLAIFDPADTWVDHPYRNGVALIGDAAAASDPSWGQGMSLTLRDVRTLADALGATDDRDAAGHAYAAAHDDYYAVIHRVDQWFTDLFLEVGPEAEAVRARAIPGIMADFTRIVDVQFGGPELPADEQARRRLFSEE